MQPYSSRRAALLANLQGGVAIIPSAAQTLRNNDTEHPFRQNSDFFYLSGFSEPDAVLLLAPQREMEKTILFLRPRDRALEIWNGKRLGVEDAPEQLGVDAAFDISEFAGRLPDFLVGADRLHYRIGLDERVDRQVLEAVNAARHRVRRGGTAPAVFMDPGAIIHEMRLFKTPQEIETMRRAGAITRLGHTAGMRTTRPGMSEYELEAVIEYQYFTNGAQDVAYPSIVAGGDNATILHYNTNRDTLRDGALVLVDSGAEVDLYAADVTRTWPVNGTFTAEQRAVYEIVLAAQKAGIAKIRPGNGYRDYHETAVRIIIAGLLDIGLLQGTVDENISSEKYRDYYMHNTGHWIGLDVHDVGRYKDASTDVYRRLEPGMVMTVEPGIYVHRDLNCDERFKGIGVRIEDDIHCSVDGPDNLSEDIPKEIDEVESLVGSEALVAAG
ncbi:MAG: aminopeptidase P N-terminal domain-containing protein [Candidatus Eremiobacteraeota bacterium]|nr:aminopeptidase P N-terminal domain-containing protein [Candidatus Eremiobacteraeota bacterium]